MKGRVSERASSRFPAAPPRRRGGELIAGRYRLIRPLGQGATSEIWLCFNETLNLEQAIKIVDTSRASTSRRPGRALDRLLFEAEVSARLAIQTPHVVAARDVGVSGETLYLVMDYAAGRTMQAEIEARGALAPVRAARILEQLGEALGAMHQMGFLHGDVKPANVMLIDTPRGPVAKLADFGLARAARDVADVDAQREADEPRVSGSPGYMSPEQCMGTEPDHRSDLWALGVLAYEGLIGSMPFEGGTLMELAVGICVRPHEPPSRRRSRLPPSLDGWFARALSKEPSARFQSAGDMVQSYRVALKEPEPALRRLSLVPCAASALSRALQRMTES